MTLLDGGGLFVFEWGRRGRGGAGEVGARREGGAEETKRGRRENGAREA